MKSKRAIKEFEKQLRREPDNLVLRLKLAAAYREAGRIQDAVVLYRSVAVSYHNQGREAQAIGVCRSILEIAPGHAKTQALLQELERAWERLQRDKPEELAPDPPPPVAAVGERGHLAPPSVPAAASIPVAARSSRAPGGRRRRRAHRADSDAAVAKGVASGRDELPLSQAETQPARPAEPPSVPADDSRVTTEFTRLPKSSSPPQPHPRPAPHHELGSGQDSQAIADTVRRPRGSSPPPTPAGNGAARPARAAAPPPLPAARRGPPAAQGGGVVAEPRGPAASPRQAVPPSTEVRVGAAPLGPAAAATPFDESAPTAARELGMEFEQAQTRSVDAPPTPPPPPHPEAAAGNAAAPARRPSTFAGESGSTAERAREVSGVLSPRPANGRSPGGSEASTSDSTITAVQKRPGRLASDDSQTTAVRNPPLPETTEGEDEGLELARAFDRPFSELVTNTLDELRPVGAPLSVFSGFPDSVLDELARNMTLRRFAAGSRVVSEGDVGDSCFVVSSGVAVVLRRGATTSSPALVEIARLGPGSLFGECALLGERRRRATVEALSDCEIYEIPRALLSGLAQVDPRVDSTLQHFYRERLLLTTLATAPFFRPLAEECRRELLGQFTLLRCEPGSEIVREGFRAGGLYVVVLGSVRISKGVGQHRQVVLATLGEGAYFGEMSLLKGKVSCASVTAVAPSELAILGPEIFYNVMTENSVLWDESRWSTNQHQLEKNQILAGETSLV